MSETAVPIVHQMVGLFDPNKMHLLCQDQELWKIEYCGYYLKGRKWT